MPNCKTIDPLVTPYIDGQLSDADRLSVDAHLHACPPCLSRVAAERAVRDLIQARKPALVSSCAPDSLRQRCALQAEGAKARQESSSVFGPRESDGWRAPRAVSAGIPWRVRVAPLAAAATLVFIVGTAFLYQLTASSSRVLAAELAADHVKCFAMNGVLHTQHDRATVESSMLSGFGWQAHLPEDAANADLELVGSRPCLYGEGKIAHIMYRHHGEPVSLFMLPRSTRTQELVQALGHQAAIWCANNRTFVLVAREPKAEVERMASVVQASLR